MQAKKQRRRYGALSTAVLAVVLAALVGLNLLADTLERRYAWRVDASFNGVTTQSEVTREVLRELPYPVHVYALFPRGQEDGPLLELLTRYAAASPLFTWEQIDPSLNPGLLTRFRAATEEETITSNCLVVWCEATDRWKVLTYDRFLGSSYSAEDGEYTFSSLNYEGPITAAVRSVTAGGSTRVMMLAGHGELDESATGALTSLLGANGLDVYGFTLRTSEANLQPDDVVAVLSPQRDLTDEELSQLMAFADAGGSLLLTCDFTDRLAQMANWKALMRYYGFLPLEGVVIASAEEPATCYQNNRMYLIPAMEATEITQPMLQNQTDTLLLPGSRGFEIPQTADAGLTTDVVLRSSDKAYLRDLNDGRLSLERQENDAGGPFALALMAWRATASGNISRAFILGCSSLLTSGDVYAMTDAQEFIVRVMSFLRKGESMDLGIVAKTALRPQLSPRSTFPGLLAAIFLPVLVGVAALIVLGYRRKL